MLNIKSESPKTFFAYMAGKDVGKYLKATDKARIGYIYARNSALKYTGIYEYRA